MARPREHRPVSRRFMIMEATGEHGGFPVYMNRIMAEMIAEMKEAGLHGPYKWSFTGGDGYAVPVFMECTV